MMSMMIVGSRSIMMWALGIGHRPIGKYGDSDGNDENDDNDIRDDVTVFWPKVLEAAGN